MGPQSLCQHIASCLEDLYGLHLLDGPVLVTCMWSFTWHLLPQNQTLLTQCIIKRQKNPLQTNHAKPTTEHKCTVSKRYFFLYCGSDPQLLLETADVEQDCAILFLCLRLLLLWLRCRRKFNNSSAVAICGPGYSLKSHSPMVSLWFTGQQPQAAKAWT